MKSVLLAISFGAAHTMNWGAGAPAPDKPRLRGAERPAAPAPAGPTTPPRAPAGRGRLDVEGPGQPVLGLQTTRHRRSLAAVDRSNRCDPRSQ